MFHRVACLASLGACVILSGCNGGPKFVGVTGVVNQNDKPLSGAMVVFHIVGADGATTASQGITDEQGRFSLSTGGQVGAPLGEAKVTVSKYEVSVTPMPGQGAPATPPTDAASDDAAPDESAGDVAASDESNDGAAPDDGPTPSDLEQLGREAAEAGDDSSATMDEPKSLVPAKYTNEATTDLTAVITSDESKNNFVFNLTE